MMKIKNYAVFILSHGRSKNVITYKTLKKQNYTGKIYIIVDDLDNEINDYKKNMEMKM